MEIIVERLEHFPSWLRCDQKFIRCAHDCRKDLITEAPIILKRLNDPKLVKLIDVIEARLDTFFRKEVKVA